MHATARSRPAATGGGLAALAIWSASVALVRGLSESLGPVTAGALATGAGGALALVVAWARGNSPRGMLRLPRKYLLVCGGLFVGYEVFFYTGVGLARDRPTALVVGLANYLWPMLTVVLSVPLLGRRARWPLALGCVLALAGTAAATLGSERQAWAALGAGCAGVAAPLALGVAAAVTWALYSNLVRRWGRPEAGAVPFFLLASGAALGLLRLGRPETSVWTLKAGGELAVLAIAQSAAGYVLWEIGMRRGNHLLLSLASYFTPVASIAIAAGYLRVAPGAPLIAGSVLVTVGAVICRYSLTDSPPEP